MGMFSEHRPVAEATDRKGWWIVRCIWGLVGVLVCTWSVPALGVVGGTVVADSDRRLDGVGLLLTDQPWNPCGGWISGTCTLIGNDRVILARHSVENAQRQLPAAGSRVHKVRFRRGADGVGNGHYAGNPGADCTGGYQEIFIQRYIVSASTGLDVVVGVLEQAPVGIAPLPLHVSHTARGGEPVTLAGWGFDGTCLGVGEAWTLRTAAGALPTPRVSSWCCVDYNYATFTTGNCFVIPSTSNWVVGNLHDSGAPLLSPDPADPDRLRVFALVTSVTSANRLSAWNDAGGQPALADTPPPPPSCLRDFDGDGLIGVGDLLRFVQDYMVGRPSCDIDGVPGVTLNDLFVYLTRYLVGC